MSSWDGGTLVVRHFFVVFPQVFRHLLVGSQTDRQTDGRDISKTYPERLSCFVLFCFQNLYTSVVLLLPRALSWKRFRHAACSRWAPLCIVKTKCRKSTGIGCKSFCGDFIFWHSDQTAAKVEGGAQDHLSSCLRLCFSSVKCD